METKKLFAVALIASLAFAACSNDEEEVMNSQDIVRINSTIDQTASSLRASIDPYSGAGDFENNDVWGMYATVNSTQVMTNGTYTVGSTILYWSGFSETLPVTFSAYYPRAATVSDPAAYMFNAAGAANPDLLVATPVAASKGSTVNLSFKHVMHQLVISLIKDAGVAGDVDDTEVTLLNMKSSAKVNLLTGVVDATGATGSATYPGSAGGGIFFVAPQDLTANTNWIQLELAGKTYTYKVPATLKNGGASNPTRLESGQRVRLTLTLKKSGDVQLTQAISEWINQGTGVIEEDVTEN